MVSDLIGAALADIAFALVLAIIFFFVRAVLRWQWAAVLSGPHIMQRCRKCKHCDATRAARSEVWDPATGRQAPAVC
jgi:hypothetical protein